MAKKEAKKEHKEGKAESKAEHIDVNTLLDEDKKKSGVQKTISKNIILSQIRRKLALDQIRRNLLLGRIRQQALRTWIDRLSFPRIFLLWMAIIIAFGLSYQFFSNGGSYLHYAQQANNVNTFKDAIYFSFVTATTTGFGDIIPVGTFKMLAIVEVLFGLLLLALVTSKLVSIKQDIILTELYEFSFEEKLNRMRSSLLYFRQNLNRIMAKVEEHRFNKREINEININLSSFEHILTETYALVRRTKNNQFVKNLDPVNAGLILNSIITSFEKFHELIILLDQHKLQWRTDATVTLIRKIILLTDELFAKINGSRIMTKSISYDVNTRKNKIVSQIKGKLIAPTDKPLNKFF